MFLCSGGGTKTKHYIFVKNVRSPRTLFFLENTAVFFGAKRRTNERSERNSETEVERLQGGRAECSQGRRSNAENERSERRAEGGERKRDDRAKGERAERASIYRLSAETSNSTVEKCSLFVVSSPLIGGDSTLSARTRKRGGTERRSHRFLSVICSRIREIDCRNVRSLAFLLP